MTGKKFFCRGTPSPGIARTCYGYVVGGMPLVFTQEDCLVVILLVLVTCQQCVSQSSQIWGNKILSNSITDGGAP